MGRACINKTYITLISMVPKYKHMDEFCPINLGNVSYKIISKVLINKQKFLILVIFHVQSTFVSTIIITDNAILSFQCTHVIKV